MTTNANKRTVTVPASCPGCLTARVQARQRGGWQTCAHEGCGARWKAPEHSPAPVVTRVARLPPLPVHAPAPQFDPARHAWRAAVDLEELAAPRWIAHFYGRGIAFSEPVDGGGASPTRPTDAAPDTERQRVTAIHARFERMRQGVGRTHYAVLHWVFIEHGPIERTRWEGFMAELGWAFASAEQRLAWRGQRRSVASGAPRKLGERLYDAAVTAYAHAAT